MNTRGCLIKHAPYGWLLLARPELDDLVTQAHMANTTLTEAGWGQQLLCSVFGFVPGPDAAAIGPVNADYLSCNYNFGVADHMNTTFTTYPSVS